MARWDEATLDRALTAAEEAIRRVQTERPHVKSSGTFAYAALKASLPILEAALPEAP